MKTQASALSLSLGHDAFPCGAALQAARSPRLSARGPSADNDNNEGVEAIQGVDVPPRLVSSPTSMGKGTDLARRSQQRVADRKRSELERREEEEQRRRTRSERDQLERDRAARVKLRRRAEIYALNAILRELQQRKIAAYMDARRAQQQQQEQPLQAGGAGIGV